MKPAFAQGLPWILLTLICLAAGLYGLARILPATGWDKRKQRRVLTAAVVIITAWVAVLSVASLRGFFADFNALPPRPLLAIVLPMAAIMVFAFSSAGTQLLRATPPQWLILPQAFRIVVELLLLLAFLAGKLPEQMTLEGRNWDILTGLLAVPAGYFCFVKKSSRPFPIAVAFNILGLLLLFNILVVAALSMPTPMRHFMNEPANTLVAYFPFILLPGVLVPIAFGLHVFSLRQLFLLRPQLLNR